MPNLTIKEQPSPYILGKSPIIYSVLSTDYAFDDFEYIADVYIWQGDITSIPVSYSYRLRKPRNATTGATMFDVSSLTSDTFINLPSSFATPDATDEMETYIYVSFGYAYTDGGGTGQTELDVTASNVITAFNGYSFYADGVNYFPTTYLGYSSGDRFMSSRPLISYIPNDTNLFFGMVYDTGQEVVKIKYVLKGSSTFETVYLDLATYDEGLIEFGVGVPNLPTHSMVNTDIVYYTVSGIDSGGATVTQPYLFYIQNGCKYGYKNFQFLNRFGVWDSMVFRAARQDQFTVSKEEVMLSPLSLDSSSEFNFNQAKGQHQNFINNGRDQFTYNTGFIDEDWNDVIKQLMMSEWVFDADTLEPYTVDSSSLTMQSALNDKLINYGLTFKKAFTYINTLN